MPSSIKAYLQRGFASSKEIQAGTGLNSTAVSRQLKQLHDSIIKLQDGRTPRYALTCNAFGQDDKIPLITVDEKGSNTSIATLRPLVHGGFFIEATCKTPKVFLGEQANGLYDDLPYFLNDLCPQGFIGRQIAQTLAAQSGEFPSDPRRWHNHHIGRYLIANGDDLSGNLKLGQQNLYRVQHKPFAHEEQDYPILASNVMSGAIPGSSAGGEQPKFTAFNATLKAHVIVKFSPLGDNDVAKRWRDILITEYHALKALHNANIPVAKTRLIEREGRLFLESQRFDRVAEQGRLPMISLQAVDAEFIGLGNDWLSVINALHKKQLINKDDVYNTEYAWQFGRLINNTDMHLGNLSLGIKGDVFKLLPIYDMCAMGFAPKSGEVVPYQFEPSKLSYLHLDEKAIASVKQAARNFWQSVKQDERISAELRNYLNQENSSIFYYKQ